MFILTYTPHRFFQNFPIKLLHLFLISHDRDTRSACLFDFIALGLFHEVFSVSRILERQKGGKVLVGECIKRGRLGLFGGPVVVFV
jgi:hypothetical protein